MKNIPKWLIVCLLIFVSVTAALIVLLYLVPEISGALEETAIVEYGEIKITMPAKAVVVRDEQVVYSDSDGNTAYYIEENTKTRKDTKVVDIYKNEGCDSYKTPITGVVSYFYDGYEEYFSLDDITTLETFKEKFNFLDDEDKTDYIVPESCSREKIAYGDPLYKIITSDIWYTVIYVSEDEMDLFNPGKTVTLIFEQGDVKAEIINKYYLSDDSGIVIFSSSRYFKYYSELRQCDIEVVTKQSSGLILPSSAIGEIDGEKGVYVKNVNDEYSFTAVTELISDGENTVISSEEKVKVYDEIMRQFELQE